MLASMYHCAEIDTGINPRINFLNLDWAQQFKPIHLGTSSDSRKCQTTEDSRTA